MAKTLQASFAAVLVSTAMALAAPAYAAASKAAVPHETAASANVDLSHTSTPARGLKGKKLVQVDQNERKITAELNKKAMEGQTGQQSSLESSSNTQQAAAQSEPETNIQ